MSTLRMPGQIASTSSGSASERGLNLLDYEIMGEKAASLGRTGQAVEMALRRLREHEGDAESRKALVKAAADAVYAFFIQRELCGMRRNDQISRELGIPREVLARLGAK